ncbi:hypothetical protein Syun_027667 [Stephania yunnanensis]|uniref:MLO-like protein n=1 Tax=Stephania yunnanensis TaxID=152371 RepID=A0AAP0EG19_9MAGN
MDLWVWIFSVLFIFFNAHVFHDHLWLPFIPLVILLLVGTKLEAVITTMCLESRDSSTVVRGTLLVKPNDNLFWFGKPHMLLCLMHFILFQNSFQMAFFSWTWYKFGLRSCFHRTTMDIILEIFMALLIQVLCGYVTLPLYALVTQMGSSMKKAVFTERVIVGLKQWHRNAKRRLVNQSRTNSASPSPDPSPSHGALTLASGEEELEISSVPDHHSPPALSSQEHEIMEEEMREFRPIETFNGEVSFNLEINVNVQKDKFQGERKIKAAAIETS